MGLDNGILVRKDCVTNKIAQKLLSRYIDEFSPNHYEIAYWRKCWNIRRALIDILDFDGSTLNDCDYPITTKNQIDQIISYLKSLNKKTWCNDGGSWEGSIWEWEEIEDHIKEQIEALKTLKLAMSFDKNIRAFFYDSY